MSTAGAGRSVDYERLEGPTPALVWQSLAGCLVSDELLEWPLDLFALTNVILRQSEAFRFALAPAGDWPPSRFGDWALEVEQACRQWSRWVDKSLSASSSSHLQKLWTWTCLTAC